MLMWVASFTRMVSMPGEERKYSVTMITAALLHKKSEYVQVDIPNQCVSLED